MNLRTWAVKWGVSADAIQELERSFGIDFQAPATGSNAPAGSEARVQSQVVLEAPAKGMRLWRNNVGALKDSRGVPVRYGLANTSKEVNDVIKSADLIGWQRVVIAPEMVGQLIALFVSVECKEEGWTYTGTEHEAAQLQWAKLVIADGGRALFVNRSGML